MRGAGGATPDKYRKNNKTETSEPGIPPKCRSARENGLRTMELEIRACAEQRERASSRQRMTRDNIWSLESLRRTTRHSHDNRHSVL